MNKSQLIDTLSDRFDGNRRQAAHALESVIDTITREVARGEKVAITGFGSFQRQARKARWVRNPRTGERLKAKATKVPKFTPGAQLKAVVSGAQKLPKLTLDTAKKTTTSSTAKKSAAKQASPAKKTASKQAAPAKKTAAKKTAPAKKTASKQAAPAKKTAAKKTAPAKKTATKQAAPAKKTAAKKTTPAKKTAKKA